MQRHPASEPMSRMHHNGHTTAYSFDDLHRLTGRSYTKASGSPTYPATQGPDSFSYDRAGRILTATRTYTPGPNVSLSWTYDNASRITHFVLDNMTRPVRPVAHSQHLVTENL